jgi:hypothetical protein
VKKNLSQSKTKLFLLMLVFVLPFMMSWLLFYYHDHFNFNTVNHGSFINPPLDVKKILEIDTTQKMWQIAYIPAKCDEEKSQKLLYTLHQLKTALGKDTKRVSLMVVTDTTCLLKDSYDFHRIDLSENETQQLQSQFTANNFSVKNKVYLIDPMGNLFMYYADTVNPMDIFKDVKRVLEVSQIG